MRRVRLDYNIILEKLDKIESLLKFQTDEPLTIERASEFLGIKKATIYQLVFERKIPFYKPNKRLFFSKIELMQWVFSNKIKTVKELEDEYHKYGRLL